MVEFTGHGADATVMAAENEGSDLGVRWGFGRRPAACPGALIVHQDGSPAACTEELDGRCCAATGGHEAIMSCRELLGAGGCEQCSTQPAQGRPGNDVRHAVHVAAFFTGQDRCRRRRTAAGAAVPGSWWPDSRRGTTS